MRLTKKQITFPDSGVTAFLPAVSMAGIALKLSRKYPQPSPPAQMVDYGDGVKRRELNYADPDYHTDLKRWEAFLESEVQRMALGRLHRMTLSDEQKKQLDEWKRENPGEWDEDDPDGALWLEEVAITTTADFEALLKFIQGVDEEVVASTSAAFPGDVSG